MTQQKHKTFNIKFDDYNCLSFNLGHFDENRYKEKNQNDLDIKTKDGLSDLDINDFDVPHLVDPHFIGDLKKLIKKNENLVLDRIIDFIQNENTVGDIATQSKTHIKHVKEAIKHLVYYDLVVMCPKFKFENRYQYTQSFKDFSINCSDLLSIFKKCAEYIYTQIAFE